MVEIGYINCLLCKNVQEVKLLEEKIEKLISNNSRIHYEKSLSFSILNMLTEKLDEKIKIYIDSIKHLGNNIECIINNLEKCLNSRYEINLFLIQEKIDTEKLSISSIIHLLRNINNPILNGPKTAGKPRGCLKAYPKFIEIYIEKIEKKIISVTQVARELNVTRATIYNYIKKSTAPFDPNK